MSTTVQIVAILLKHTASNILYWWTRIEVLVRGQVDPETLSDPAQRVGCSALNELHALPMDALVALAGEHAADVRLEWRTRLMAVGMTPDAAASYLALARLAHLDGYLLRDLAQARAAA